VSALRTLNDYLVHLLNTRVPAKYDVFIAMGIVTAGLLSFMMMWQPWNQLGPGRDGAPGKDGRVVYVPGKTITRTQPGEPRREPEGSRPAGSGGSPLKPSPKPTRPRATGGATGAPTMPTGSIKPDPPSTSTPPDPDPTIQPSPDPSTKDPEPPTKEPETSPPGGEPSATTTAAEPTRTAPSPVVTDPGTVGPPVDTRTGDTLG